MKVIAILKRKHQFSGPIIVDRKTKDLVKRLKCNQIAVINHRQLDAIAAKDLIRKRPLAVINFSPSCTNKIPTKGSQLLLSAGIPLFDVLDCQDLFANLRDGMNAVISLRNRSVYFLELQANLPINQITKEYARLTYLQAHEHFDELFSDFMTNTLSYAFQERNSFLAPFPIIQLNTSIKQRNVVIVSRGHDAFEDFAFLLPYIRKKDPIFIGVDGGADIIMQFGYVPHIVIGDMDSVSDDALKLIQDRIVHSYPSGKTPGLRRLQQLALEYQILPYVGTSEDVAILLAYEQKAEHIILIGFHTHMLDFLEKGREGMASTLLTRMKAGHLITDVRGIHSILQDLHQGETNLEHFDYYSRL